MQDWLLLPRWVPESARWLLTQGRVEEAQTYLFRCAALNGKPVGEDSLSQEVRVAVCMRLHRGGWAGVSECPFSWSTVYD